VRCGGCLAWFSTGPVRVGSVVGRGRWPRSAPRWVARAGTTGVSAWHGRAALSLRQEPMGVGQARTYVAQAVQGTVPFGLLCMSLMVIWYALYGHHPDDVTDRRARQPWYTTKTEPSFEDMIAKLRRTIMMRPYVVLPRRLRHGAAFGHGVDARIPGRPPNPDHAR
jgi:hypothetical protein